MCLRIFTLLTNKFFSMNKIQKSADEMAFILSATPASLAEYVIEHPFRKTNEKMFVESAPAKVVRLYIEQHGLCPSAAVVIFRADNNALVSPLLAWCQDTAMIKTFLDHGTHQRISLYIKDFSIKELPEQQALERFDKNELLNLIAQTKLSSFAKYDILVRGDTELRAAVIKKGGLDTRERQFIIQSGTIEDLETLIATQNDQSVIKKLNQIKLVRFAKKKALLKYISANRLHHDVEPLFYNRASFEMIAAYVKHYRPEGGDLALLNYPNADGILCYLSKNWLTKQGEHLLLKRGEHDEIKAYIKSHHLNPDDEIRLIKRNRHHEIMLYLSRHSLSAEAQIELVYRRNLIELCYLVTTYPLSITDEAAEKMFQCGLTKVLSVYDEALKAEI